MSAFATFAKHASSFILALAIIQGLGFGASAAPVATSTGAVAARLLNPCGGGQAVDGAFTSPTVVHVPHELYHDMATKALEIKTLVRTLMNRYIQERFQSETFEVDSQDLRISELPTMEPASVQYLSNMQALNEAHTSYKFLAVATMFLEQARIEEDLREGGAYNRHFLDIKETGMFWMTCQLHKIITMHEASLQEETIQEALNMQISDKEDTYLRRTRDFVILRDLESMLDRTIIVFRELKETASQSS